MVASAKNVFLVQGGEDFDKLSAIARSMEKRFLAAIIDPLFKQSMAEIIEETAQKGTVIPTRLIFEGQVRNPVFLRTCDDSQFWNALPPHIRSRAVFLGTSAPTESSDSLPDPYASFNSHQLIYSGSAEVRILFHLNENHQRVAWLSFSSPLAPDAFVRRLARAGAGEVLVTTTHLDRIMMTPTKFSKWIETNAANLSAVGGLEPRVSLEFIDNKDKIDFEPEVGDAYRSTFGGAAPYVEVAMSAFDQTAIRRLLQIYGAPEIQQHTNEIVGILGEAGLPVGSIFPTHALSPDF